MYDVNLDMTDVEWENEEYKKEFYDYVESELENIEESCEDSAKCYVDDSSDSLWALKVVRDNTTSYEVTDPTNEIVIATIWYQVEVIF